MGTGSEVALGLGSALFGAASGYFLAKYQAVSEGRARRLILLRHLCGQLALVSPTMQPYNAGKTFYRDPIEISALSLLLNGRSLTYKQHAELLKELIILAAALQVHNDQVRVTNLAQTTAAVIDTTHRQMYDDVRAKHQAIITARDTITKTAAAVIDRDESSLLRRVWGLFNVHRSPSVSNAK